MITLENYLQNNNLRGLTKEESFAFGIPWPLQKGWKDRYAFCTSSLDRLKGRAKKVGAPAVAKLEPFYHSQAWKELRYRALAMYGNACKCCGASPRDGIRLHVDHIRPRSKHPMLALDITNLQILCEDCNLGKKNLDDTDWR